MKIQDFFETLPYYMQANIVPCLVAPHGVGKSSVVREYCTQNKLGFVDIRLGQMADPGDLTGLPIIEDGATKFNPTHLLPRVGKGIIFMDEINRCTKDLSQSVFQLVLDRKLGEYEVPEGYFIVAAMNPDVGEYNVSSFDDAAFLDRFAMIRLEPSPEEFCKYVKEKGHDVVAEFIATNTQFLEKKIEYGVNVTPSRRSWEAVGRLLKAGLPKPHYLSAVSSLVGVEAAATFIQFLDTQETLKWVDVVEDWKKYRPKVETLVKKGALAQLGFLIDELGEWGLTLPVEGLHTITPKKKAEKYEETIIAFLKMLPKDLGFYALSQVVIACPAFIGTPKNPDQGFLWHDELVPHFEDADREAAKQFAKKEENND